LRREVHCAGIIACERISRAISPWRRVFSLWQKFLTAQKPLIHRHFCIASIFAQDIARAEKFFADALLLRCRCTSPANAGQGSYTQNLVE